MIPDNPKAIFPLIIGFEHCINLLYFGHVSANWPSPISSWAKQENVLMQVKLRKKGCTLVFGKNVGALWRFSDVFMWSSLSGPLPFVRNLEHWQQQCVWMGCYHARRPNVNKRIMTSLLDTWWIWGQVRVGIRVCQFSYSAKKKENKRIPY